MSKLRKNIITVILITGLFLSCRISSADMVITTYYPSLDGEYSTFRLVPRSANLPNPCTIGSLYVDTNKTLNYCYNNSGVGQWGSVTDTWTQNGNDIYLSDIATQPNLRVGIGTKTPEFKLSLSNDAGIIAKGTFGSGTMLPNATGSSSRLIWYPRKAAFRAGHTSATQWDDASIGDYSSAFGKNSTASGAYSVIGGGDINTATNMYSSVIGGQNNSTNAQFSTIVGGLNNTINAFQFATITGGQSNKANQNYATVLGGNDNQASELLTVISGGESNKISSMYSSISGGHGNIIDVIAGAAPNGQAVISGGLNNKSRNWATVVAGGEENSAISAFSNIGGGQGNIVGFNYLPSWQYSNIAGGQTNTISKSYATIIGGKNNIVSEDYGAIGGGFQNTASGIGSVVGGGERNTSSGLNSVVAGGTDNIAAGDYSWSGGRNMHISSAADRTFAWGYSDSPVLITRADAFVISPGTNSGSLWNPKVGIRDINPTGVLEINANSTSDNYIEITKTNPGDVFVIKNNGYIGVNKAVPDGATYAMQFGNANGAYLDGVGIWHNASSREVKENISPLTSEIAENTLDNLNPVTFNYKVNDQTNAGFIAEDVPEIVALNDRQALSAMDIIAVLTKAAEDQQTQINRQAQEILEIQNTINKLKRKAQR